MEEEGTAVYFKTSPLVAELTAAAAAAEGGGGGGGGSLAEELLFPAGSERVEAEGGGGEGGEGRPVQGWGTAARQWLCHPPHEEIYLRQAVAMVSASPLLTEEDHHLLTAALPSLPSPSPSSSSYTSSSQPCLSVTLAALAFCGAVLAVFAALGSWLLIGVTMVIVGSVFAAIRLAGAVQSWKVKDALNQLETHLSDFTSFLTLASQATRTVQETEIISRGFARPSKSVPILRLEAQDHLLKCVPLRVRLLESCRDAILSLRAATLELCQRQPLGPELDHRHGYLALHPLKQLHEHLAADKDDDVASGEAEEEGDGHYSQRALSLLSLKDASNLLAVQNSELLRRLALGVGVRGVRGGAVRAVMASLSPALREQHRKLQWSLHFHRNCLFGDPPKRMEREGAEEQDPLAPLAAEVRWVDLRCQQLLQGVREVGDRLAKDRARGGRGGNGGAPRAEVEVLQERLTSLQRDLRGISDHLEEGRSFLQRLWEDAMPSHDAHHRGRLGSDSEKAEGEEEEEEGEGEGEGEGQQQDYSSEDEMVFEAYVPLLPGVEGEGEGQGEEPLAAAAAAAEREVPRHLLKELRSVLEVRGAERERRRELKQRTKKQRKETPSQQQTPQTVPVEKKAENTAHQRLENTAGSVSEGRVEDAAHQRVKTVSPADHTSDPSTRPVTQSSIAQTVAALAARRRPHRTEQVFQELSCEEDTEEGT